jgi:YD repeat-containing protein
MYYPARFWHVPSKQRPCFAATIARETHFSDRASASGPRFPVRFEYYDGFSRTIQSKSQAKPVSSSNQGVSVAKRWAGTGWTIYNNKCSPVRKFEPSLDDTHDFKFDMRIDVSSTPLYDSLECVLHPDHSFEKTEFDAWTQKVFDGNDNVAILDLENDDVVGPYFKLLPEKDYKPSWSGVRSAGQLGRDEQNAALKTAAHTNTPSTSHLDPFGRVIVSVKDNGVNGLLATVSQFDIQGNVMQVTDARSRVVSRTDYDMLSSVIHTANMDSGERWILKNVVDLTLYMWNSRQFRHRTAYNALHRLVALFWSEGDGLEPLAEKYLYGESVQEPETRNLRGKECQVMDQAGVLTTSQYDFKSNLLHSSRQLAENYKETLTWSHEVPLEAAVPEPRTTFDALNRPVKSTSLDGSITFWEYNETGRLQRVLVNVDVCSWRRHRRQLAAA